MKYAGNITILDEDGNAVFEQDLNQDQIVEALLAAIPGEEERHTKEKVSPETASKERACGACGKSGHTRRTCGDEVIEPAPRHTFAGKECCGSKGKRHMKGCTATEASIETRKQLVRVSERQWKEIKVFQNTEGWSSLKIANEMNIPLELVNLVVISQSYDSFVRRRLVE